MHQPLNVPYSLPFRTMVKAASRGSGFWVAVVKASCSGTAAMPQLPPKQTAAIISANLRLTDGFRWNRSSGSFADGVELLWDIIFCGLRCRIIARATSLEACSQMQRFARTRVVRELSSNRSYDRVFKQSSTKSVAGDVRHVATS